jgi:hypothetical protein
LSSDVHWNTDLLDHVRFPDLFTSIPTQVLHGPWSVVPWSPWPPWFENQWSCDLSPVTWSKNARGWPSMLFVYHRYYPGVLL